MPTKQKQDLKGIKGIKSPADLYGWKKHIVEAIKLVDLEYGRTLEQTTSLLAFYQEKDKIIEKLKLNDENGVGENGD